MQRGVTVSSLETEEVKTYSSTSRFLKQPVFAVSPKDSAWWLWSLRDEGERKPNGFGFPESWAHMHPNLLAPIWTIDS